MIIKPQPGYQEKILSCPADIVFGWWEAGAGKTFALLMDPVRWFYKPWFQGIIFRRTGTQITGGGGLWDESIKMYSGIKWAVPTETKMKWVIDRKSVMKFSHLEYEKDKLAHQGLQYAFEWFDEITHFTKTQFFYLLSRNRSTCGINPYVRCTCNPDPESWVAEFIEWYLDEDGYIIPERDGIIRYFTIDSNVVIWGDTKDEVIDTAPHLFEDCETEEDKHNLIKSFTFIKWKLDDNKELLAIDKSYRANLAAQDEATKMALMKWCWKPVQDDKAIVNYSRLKAMFSNYPETKDWKFITCDVAGFGKDLAVIKTWEGWEVMKTQIFTKSWPDTLKEAIENERKENNIPVDRVAVDNDGMGWGLVDMGYYGFNGGGSPIPDPDTAIKENYANLKTQCYYRMIEQNINTWDIRINMDNVYVDWELSKQVKIGKKVYDIDRLIMDNIKAIKRAKIDAEGKKCINSKKEQKVLLWGLSPDFGDTIMMRKIFDLIWFEQERKIHFI